MRLKSPKKKKAKSNLNYTNPWCGLECTHAQDHITLERVTMDSCSLLLGLISVARLLPKVLVKKKSIKF